MKVLIIGGGGREHALVQKIAASAKVKQVFCAPGNAGIAKSAKCIPIAQDDLEGLLAFAQKEKIDLTIVGPEKPLADGIVDTFKRVGLKIFGPTAEAAQLEGSKVFSKQFCERFNIPTASAEVFSNVNKAMSYLETQTFPLVIKADGLAAGKGVSICKNKLEAEQVLKTIMVDRVFGAAGGTVVIEEFLSGEELSFLSISDGNHILPLASSQDHKAAYDGDQGPNTGGMGAYSPAPLLTAELHDKVVEQIILPAIRGMVTLGCDFVGVLYAGLMIKAGEPKVLEFNVRFGDPETQPLLARLKTDLIDIFLAAIDGTLDKISLEWDPRPAVCVVMAAKGYPGSYEKGKVINGLSRAEKLPDTFVYHAGTKSAGKSVLTNGGRVLGVTALGDDLATAIQNAYHASKQISWDGSFYRKDIGQKALRT